MNDKVLRVLEFHKIIEQLAGHASSEGGRQLCMELAPSTSLGEITSAQQETSDALARILKKGSLSFSAVKSIKASTKRLERGGSLSAAELLQIASLLENAARVKSYGRRENADVIEDCLDPYFSALEPVSNLSAEIRRCILAEDEISDDASSTLRHIRRSMKIVNDRIHTQLNSMVNGSARTYLQDAVVTMRQDRYCIPVKAEYKSQVPGMIHDQSSTGSTIFIEPAAVVQLNNELKELYLKEEQEITVILSGLSATASEYTEQIAADYDLLTRLDFIFAKAELALSHNATMPVFHQEHKIKLRQARHPLLDKKKVVPIDIRLGDDFDLLIVTGPNTGGKTVSLKTIGLLSLMGQAGLHIPTLDRSELSVFTEIFADIGDEQSIEQSLSTFSSHMTNIVTILENADAHSLCLFDELGAGTDPTEGAALAISILSHLHERGIRAMATTHYSELKVFALSTPGVENACCEFNVETLQPTYRLLVGVPGKSNAFAISGKLGLPDYIITDAKGRIGEKDISFEDLLTDLEQSRLMIEKEQAEISRYKEEVKQLKEKLEEKQSKLEESRDKVLRKAHEDARAILQEAKDTADETIKNFHKYAASSPNIKKMERDRERLRQKMSKSDKALSYQGEKPVQKNKAADFHIGDSVKVLSMGVKGTVSTLPDAKGNMFVQCGILRSQVNMNDVILLDDDVITTPSMQRSSTGKIKMSKSAAVSTEIKLLGMTVDEALSVLDKYLDDAYLAHLPSVRVVHGKGTGALRNAVHGLLRRQKHVSEFHLAAFGEGDAGVTIVTFK